MEIRRIRTEEWRELRELRLRALQDSPDVFGSAYERESTDPDEDWQAWAEAGARDEDQALFIASAADGWIGMTMGARGEEVEDMAHVFAMWVDPPRRHSGVGTALVDAVADWARGCGATRLRLRVTETNTSAMALYMHRGFVPLGVREPLRPGSRNMTALMELDLGEGSSEQAVASQEHDEVVAEQMRYYEDRSAEYEDVWFRRGPYDLGPESNARWFAETERLERAGQAFADSGGSVLELACGTGMWTRFLAATAERLLAVDASPAVLEINRGRHSAANVEFAQVDLWDWDPPGDEQFDRIFMGFFISHIPPERFAPFWDRMRGWLAPGGSVFVCDDAANSSREQTSPRVENGPEHAHVRSLNDGTEYSIVKIFYSPAELTSKLAEIGWSADLATTGEEFVYGTVRPG